MPPEYRVVITKAAECAALVMTIYYEALNMYDEINFQTYRIAGRFFNQYPPALLAMWAFVAVATYLSIGA